MAMSTVTIDATFMSGKTAPISLNQDNTRYQLAVDVALSQGSYFGQIFKLVGKNVYLDLNGHTVRNNGLQVPQIRDSHLGNRSSESCARGIGTNDLHTFGGTYLDGEKTKPVIDPTTPEYPPIVPYADTK